MDHPITKSFAQVAALFQTVPNERPIWFENIATGTV